MTNLILENAECKSQITASTNSCIHSGTLLNLLTKLRKVYSVVHATARNHLSFSC
ncbi:hypothetical protein OIU77_030891 [Salix suchowensis]|uniref:Uncharacterized protein n=1 Tax=Salix suchowensis TaxID=1278906 RepID=A0ABQ9BDH9_9ROSI|nr:hypothetical protein OIU77_030891 [Salix suchowensis]